MNRKWYLLRLVIFMSMCSVQPFAQSCICRSKQCAGYFNSSTILNRNRNYKGMYHNPKWNQIVLC